MAGTVNLFGSPVKRGYVIAGGGVIVVAIGYGWYKNKKAAAAGVAPAGASAASTPSAAPAASYAGGYGADPYPADGTTGNSGDPNSTDPASGATYGDEQSGFATGYGALGYDGYSGYGTTAYYPPGVTGGQVTYTSNAQWAQAAESYLTGTVGSDPTTISAALGKYLTGQALTGDQVAVVEQAIAFTGQPPVQGADGFPPSYRTAPASAPPPSTGGGTTGTGTGTTGTGTGTTGTGTGTTTTTAAPSAAPAGYSATGHAGFADFGWGAVPAATKYELVVQGAGGAGTGTSHVDSTVTGTHAGNVKLSQGRYTAHVRAGNTAGWGPWAAPITFTVTK